jgi:predicted transcriptional regulator of viral defense system
MMAAPIAQRSASQLDRRSLFAVAPDHAGYFTAAQARGCGFSWALLAYHEKTGRFLRVRQGLYRLRDYPASPREHVLAAWLAVGKETAVVSHESALDLLGLSEVVPNAVHLTVPRARRGGPSLPGVTIHTTTRALDPTDRVWRDGMAVTAATRSILDAAEAGTAPEQIALAVAQAVERGQVIPEQLRRRAGERGRRVAELVDQALQLTSR